jgi:hypothetical protein
MVTPNYLKQTLFFQDILIFFLEQDELFPWVEHDPLLERFLAYVDPGNLQRVMPLAILETLWTHVFLYQYLLEETPPPIDIVQADKAHALYHNKKLEAFMATRAHYIGQANYLEIRLGVLARWGEFLDPQTRLFCPDPALRQLILVYAIQDWQHCEESLPVAL